MAGTVAHPIGITDPPIDDLLEKVDSKYALVIIAAKRARQINAYYSQLADGLLENVGPLVEAHPQEKPLSIAMREIDAGLLDVSEDDGTHVVATPLTFGGEHDLTFGDDDAMPGFDTGDDLV